MMTTVLAIHAHPDDIEFQCAGTLLRLAERDVVLHVATMTPGDCGSAEMSAEQISEVRRGEAARAAGLLGAEYHCLEFRDLSIVFDNPSRRRVAECLRPVRPDIVLTAPPVDYMPDHEMTSLLVRDACFNAPIPNYTTGADDPGRPLERIPSLYYVDPIEGVDWFGQPQPAGMIVDVSATFARKLGGARVPAGVAAEAARHGRVPGELSSVGCVPGERNRCGLCRGLPPAPRASVPRRERVGAPAW